jgi:phospholipid/cholesterol/gamma-HCH transport system substrate-binding protein
MYEMQKKITWAGLRTGIVITLGLIFLFASILLVGNISNIFSPKSTIMARIINVQGLRKGAPVWLYGVEIGTVSFIKLTNCGSVVVLAIEKKQLPSVHKNAVAELMTMGILGDKYIEITPGTTNLPSIEPGDTIAGQSPLGLEQITSAAVMTMTVLDSSVQALHTILSAMAEGNGSFNKFLNDPTLYNSLTASLNSFRSIIEEFDTSKGTINRLMQSPELYRNMNEVIGQLSGILNRVNYEIGDGKGAVGTIVNDTTVSNDIRQSIKEFKDAAKSANDLIKDIKANPKKYINLKIF